MHRGRGQRSQALVVLPLALAVLLVSLCVPVACFASPENTVPVSSAPETCGHDTAALASAPMHTAPVAGTPTPVHQHGSPLECKHSNANVQAVGVDQPVRLADVVSVPAVTAPLLLASAPVATFVDERPAKPPGLVLTVSQLRI